MNIFFLILLGFVSAVPVGPSLYELFQFNLRSEKFRKDLLLSYLVADLIHIGLAWGLAAYITNSLIANCLLICAAVFMLGSAFRLWNQQMLTEHLEAFALPGGKPKRSHRSEKQRIFFLTLTNPGIFLFYLSLFSGHQLGFTALLVLLASFVVSLLFLMISTKRAKHFFESHKQKFNKGVAVLFSLLAMNFLLQIS